MALINRKPTERQTLLAQIVIYRLENDLPLSGDVLTAVGYPLECLFDGRNDYYLAKGFLQELCRLAPPELDLTEETAYRFVKEELLSYSKPKKRRPRPKTRAVWSSGFPLVGVCNEYDD